MCTSCPHACIVGTVLPRSSVVVRLLANANPVASFTGSASKSVRTNTVGPSPFFKTPTTPCPPMPVLTLNPIFSNSAANVFAVSFS